MGSSFLRRLTLIKQASYGSYATDLTSAVTGIVPTGFKGDYHDMKEFQDPGESEYNGFLVPVGRPIQVGDMAEVPFDGDLTFENVDYLLNIGWKSVVTGAGSATPYTRDYTTPAEKAINAPTLVIAQAGDNSTPGNTGHGYGYGTFDCFITDFDVSAARGGFTTASGTFSGHSLRALTNPENANVTTSRLGGTSIPAWMWKVFIDPVSGTIGTTQLTGTLIDWSMKVSSKYHHKTFQDGAVTPTSYGQGRPEVTLDMTFEQNIGIQVEFTAFQASTPRMIRLSATSGSNVIKFDLYGYYTAFDKPGDSDGNTTIKASFKCKYITSVTNFWEATTISAKQVLFT